jgi:hypothetical protein
MNCFYIWVIFSDVLAVGLGVSEDLLASKSIHQLLKELLPHPL